jgi:hypothetical protein
MQDDCLPASQHSGEGPCADRPAPTGEPASHAAGVPRRMPGPPAPALACRRAEETFGMLREALARCLDRCTRGLENILNGAEPESASPLAADLDRLYAELDTFCAWTQRVLDGAATSPPAVLETPHLDAAINLADLELLQDLCRRLLHADALLADRLRPHLQAAWRAANDPWLELGARCESRHRAGAAELSRLREGLQHAISWRLGVEPGSEWESQTLPVCVTSQPGTLEELLARIVLSPPSLITVETLVAAELPRIEPARSRVLFAALMPLLTEAAAHAATPDAAGRVERILTLFAGRSYFTTAWQDDGFADLLAHLVAQHARWGVPPAAILASRPPRPQPGDGAAVEAVLASLPLILQRQLVRQGRFLHFFARHADHLVAREVFHFLHPGNLEELLHSRDANQQLLEEILRLIDLGQRPELLILALSHPRCPLVFAGRHLPRLNQNQLHRIIQDPATGPEVRRKAMLAMIQRRSGQIVASGEAAGSKEQAPTRS